MPNPRKSLLNKTFGLLTVKERLGQNKPGGNSIWRCDCQCGGTCKVLYQHLTTGRTRSCGCLKKAPRQPL